MIFLDNNATTPILASVVAEMLQDLDGTPRNPSSITKYGREGRDKLNKARRILSDYFGVSEEEIVFTSGGTESNNFLIKGFFARKPGTVITTQTEHASVLTPICRLKCNAKYIEVDSTGVPSIQQIESELNDPSFIILSGANNETGAMIDIEEMADFAKSKSIPLIIDGIAMLGKTELSIPDGVSAASFSSHKIHGPKGVGFAIVKKRYKLNSLISGGHQEQELRAGTENLPGILGMVKAVELIPKKPHEYIQTLRDTFEDILNEELEDMEINCTGKRISNTSNIYIKDIDAEALLVTLDQNGVIASVGSACSSGSLTSSHVLLGMGYPIQRALSSIRFSFSRQNTMEEVVKAAHIVTTAVKAFVPN